MRREGIEQLSDALPCGLDGALGGFSQEQFEFGEDLLDRVEVRTVGPGGGTLCCGESARPCHVRWVLE